MKTFPMAVLLAGLTIAGVQAQNLTEKETVTIAHVRKGEEPQQVLETLKNDFSEAIVKDMTLLPSALHGKEWAITEQEILSPHADVNFYQVQASGKNVNLSAIYNKQGQLISYREHLKHAELPPFVKKTLDNQFPGYQIAKSQERIRVEAGKEKIAYKVALVSGKKHRIVFLDGQGKVTRTAKPLHI